CAGSTPQDTAIRAKGRTRIVIQATRKTTRNAIDIISANWGASMKSSAFLRITFLIAAASAMASGQQKGFKPPEGPAPRLWNGKPDFRGVWQTPRMADVTKDEACCK